MQIREISINRGTKKAVTMLLLCWNRLSRLSRRMLDMCLSVWIDLIIDYELH